MPDYLPDSTALSKLEEITAAEVVSALKGMPSGKANGNSWISIALLKSN